MPLESSVGNSSSFEIYFGGPDRPAGYLRDILEQHIAAVPPGGSIDWVTYYFRDMKLAQAIVQAHRRGVSVTVTLAGKPRVPEANDAVIALLSGHGGLGNRMRVITSPGIPAPRGKSWKPQLHEKLYCFSDPAPIAFVGSFNPSGNMPHEERDILREIGDQDRGHNVLVGITDPLLVTQLVKHARRLHETPPGPLYRFSADANREIKSGGTAMYFWPRVGPHPIVRFLNHVSDSAHLRIVASHIRAESAIEVMAGLARRGVKTHILGDSTSRRVTEKVERRLSRTEIRFKRIKDPDGLPMHLKFVLIDDGPRVWSIFGSFNWTKPSFWLNYEIAVISNNLSLFKAFSDRWDALENGTLSTARQAVQNTPG
jgi:phosphatidylserine/phosphatidylglycerophosphate/cardiolipin synthase-like enzyme